MFDTVKNLRWEGAASSTGCTPPPSPHPPPTPRGTPSLIAVQTLHKHLGLVVRKPVNANSGLKLTHVFFSLAKKSFHS